MAKRRRRQKIRQQATVEFTEFQAREFMRIVRDDLIFLKTIDFRRPSRTDVRVSSSILRRLLQEEMLQNAWTFSGLADQPVVSGVDLTAVVANIPPHFIQYAYAGGATTDGAHHEGYVLLAIPSAEWQDEGKEDAAKRIQKLVQGGARRDFTLSEFCQSPAVISGKGTVSRLGVIRYVANKLGGVHWDSKRGAWTDPIGSRHRLLDEEHLIVGMLPAPLYEVVSVAQDLARSNDCVRLIERIGQVAPEQERSTNVISFREGRVGKYADVTFG